MKKIIALMLAVVMLLSFAACESYKGGAKYAVHYEDGKSPAYYVAGLSNVLSSDNIPVKLVYSVQSKQYDSNKVSFAGNRAYDYAVKCPVLSLQAVADLESSNDAVYRCRLYGGKTNKINGLIDVSIKNVKATIEEIRYYFKTQDFEELAGIIEKYKEAYFQTFSAYSPEYYHSEGVSCSLQFNYTKYDDIDLSAQPIFSMSVNRDDAGQLYISVKIQDTAPIDDPV